MAMKHLELFFLLFLPLFSLAQDDYRADQRFFEEQLEVYENWLSRHQLDQYFQFEAPAMKVTQDRLTLYLGFRIEGIDASINGIRQLSAAYLSETGQPLNEMLLRKAMHIFEMPPEAIVLRVRSLRTNEGRGVDTRLSMRMNASYEETNIPAFSILRSEVKDSLVVPTFALPQEMLICDVISENSENFKRTTWDICRHIEQKAAAFFGPKGSFAPFPGDQRAASFEVKNLKHQVIPEGVLTLLDPYEKLTFTIRIQPDGEQGIKFLTVLDGKYGPGLFKPRSGDYHEMDPQYAEELRSYLRDFLGKYLSQWLAELDK